jgi:dual specificity phosphatase 3
LQRIGITHVLNAAEGKQYGMVNTDKNYYKDIPIKYLGLQILDLPSTDISQFFFIVACFIAEAVSYEGK